MQLDTSLSARRLLVRASALCCTLFLLLLFSLIFIPHFNFLATAQFAAQTPTAAHKIYGESIEVNSLVVPGDGACDVTQCTLYEAIFAANNTLASDIITFAPNLSGTIQLTDKLYLSSSMTIEGPGADKLTLIAGSGTGLGIFDIGSSDLVTVTIQGLSLVGAAEEGMTAINVGENAHVTIEDSIIKDNEYNGFAGAMSIAAGSVAIISNSTISNSVAIQGGAIVNRGDLSIFGSTLLNNRTTGSLAEGGAIQTISATLTIVASTFMSNGVSSNNGGGIASVEGSFVTISQSNFLNNLGAAIYNSASTLTITNTTFTNNRGSSDGGALRNGGSSDVGAGGVVTVTNSTFVGNRGENGGAIANRYGGTVTLRNSTLEDNVAELWGGGAFNERSTIFIINSTIDGNRAERGGGLANRRQSQMNIDNSTISNNEALSSLSGQCGGITNDGINSTNNIYLAIRNSTISGNHADTFGGGICNLFSFGQTSILNSTIVLNRADYDNNDDMDIGGGIYNSGATTTFGSSIFAKNYRGTESILDNFSQSATSPGTFNSVGYNLSDSQPEAFTDTDFDNSDPLIAPLGDYGGPPTPTHGLFVGSPAIDGGVSFSCPAIDQHGVTRPQDGDETPPALCDIGAFEVDEVLLEEKEKLLLPRVEK